MSNSKTHSIEWLTLAVFFIVYVGWLALLIGHEYVNTIILIISLSFLVALHSSLQHEVIHDHPTSSSLLNSMLAFPALGLIVPFRRYKILHLKHHRNWLLTDPFEDSESFFVTRKSWLHCNPLIKKILKFNNTMLGRLLIGVLIMITRILINEYRYGRKDRNVQIAWILHAIGVSLVICILWFAEFSILFYILCVTLPANTLLILRSYGEHLPEENIEHRSAIIKSNWIMQLLYLNNNFHRVHHDHPNIAWYNLPSIYRQHYLQHNIHVYKGYFVLFKRFALKRRFPVEHPFLSKDKV